MKRNPAFIDFLNLGRLDPDRYDWIVFCGVSGSGKSTAIQWLQEHRPDPGRVPVDEIRTTAAMRQLIRNRDPERSYLIASHVPFWKHRILKPRGIRQLILRTDRNRGQIEAWLDRGGFTYSETAIRRFTKNYGASFVDLKFIAESCRFRDFDTAFHQFEKLQRIEWTPEQ